MGDLNMRRETVRWRAICRTCRWRGKWRMSEYQAKQDEKSHKLSYSSHETEIVYVEIPEIPDIPEADIESDAD